MPTPDREFLKRLRATFNIEAEEHLQAISSTLLELEKSPPDLQRSAAVEIAYREAHSLKGASRAVDLTQIESICQTMESIFAEWKRQNIVPSADAFDALHQSLEEIRQLLESSDPESPSETPAPKTIPTANFPPADPEKTLVSETVRIGTVTLDARLSEAEEMLVIKSIATQRALDLRELAQFFERWWEQWTKISSSVRGVRRMIEQTRGSEDLLLADTNSLMQFLDWNCDYVRSLENRLSLLAGQATHDRHEVAKRVDDLLDGAKKLLMLPFSTLTEIFPKMVRDVCRQQAKEADFVIHGSDVVIDKRILEQLKDPLLHILRNSIDHGIETKAERTKLNKPPKASIKMTIAQVNGNKIEINISDDGAGIDIEKLKKSAVIQGAISAAEADRMSNQDAFSLIFQSGVSTSPSVTTISGRGLGMAIVRSNVEKLGGKVFIDSRPGRGTTLRLMLPVTLSTFRGVLLAAAGETFVAPTLNVERVLRIKPDEIKTVENRETLSIDGRPLSLVRLDAVLELPAKPTQSNGSSHMTVAVLVSNDQRIGFVVDRVEREEEVVVKPLRKPLTRVRNIAGATVLGSGKVVTVLNVQDLMKSARKYGAAPLATDPVPQLQSSRKRILVVEDSITSRMLLKSILETADYEVKTAVDGIDAFTILREEAFDLVVSDVEMPRLNGMDLTARIRADKRLSELPVVLVTALESPHERERGIDVGANAYIIKSSFDQSNLLEAVRRLIGAA